MKNGSVWQKFWFHLVWDIIPLALVLYVLRIMLIGIPAHAQAVDPCVQWGRDLAGNRFCMAIESESRGPYAKHKVISPTPAGSSPSRLTESMMSVTTTAPNNKTVAYKRKPMREPSGAAKKSVTRKKAKSAINRGLISEKAAKRHLSEY